MRKKIKQVYPAWKQAEKAEKSHLPVLNESRLRRRKNVECLNDNDKNKIGKLIN